MKLVLVNITYQEKQISIEVKITYYFFHANKLHSNAMYSSCENKDMNTIILTLYHSCENKHMNTIILTLYSSCENKHMNTIILTLSLHKLPQYIKVEETVIESTQYMSRINEIYIIIYTTDQRFFMLNIS